MAKSATGKDAPDPSLAGPIRNIVASAHKWGGDGHTPDFNKIKRVLMEKHPEVVAKAFGGDPNKAAAWIKDNWMALHGRNPWSWRKGGRKGSTVHAGFSLADLYEDGSELDSDPEVVELFCAGNGQIEEKDGLLWYPISRTGEWMRSPLPGKKPLRLTKDIFEKTINAFRDKAWEYVTLPLTHEDRTDENTGYIEELELRDDPVRPGEYRLWGGHRFTDKTIEEKVRSGSIIGRSVGLAINGHVRPEDGQFFPYVLKHVCLTNKPWLNGLNDGLVAAAQNNMLYEPGDITVDSGSYSPEENDNSSAPPPEAGYHKATGDQRCSNCQYFNDGDCEYWDASVEGDHVSNAFVSNSDHSGDDNDAKDAHMELHLGWLPSNVSQSDLDDGDFAVVATVDGRKVRKLPFKVHGAVNPAGWKAAWNVINGGRGGVDLPSGVSVAAIKKKLLANKPKGVQVNASFKITKGGDNMPKEENEKEGTEGTEILLSQEQFQDAVSKAIADRDSIWEERLKAQELRLSQTESENRKMRVRETIKGYESKGVPPAVLTVAEDLMLAEADDDGLLTLSQEDGDVKLSHSDAISRVLDAIPADLRLDKDELDLSKNGGKAPDEGDDADADKKAEKLWEELKTQPAVQY